MKIGVLTYAAPHKKTWDTLLMLKSRGYDEVEVFARPFSYKKEFTPIYKHRPEFPPEKEFDTKELCDKLAYRYQKISEYEEIDNYGVFLVCGAGLLPQSFIKRNTVINAHPGYIPNCRGLDALKWAIVEEQPIGVTTHLIGDYVDAGEIIERNTIEIVETDSFYSVAQRVYDTEINMLVSAIEMINEEHIFTDGEGYPVHKRMPHAVELELMDKFNKRKMLNSGRGK